MEVVGVAPEEGSGTTVGARIALPAWANVWGTPVRLKSMMHQHDNSTNGMHSLSCMGNALWAIGLWSARDGVSGDAGLQRP